MSEMRFDDAYNQGWMDGSQCADDALLAENRRLREALIDVREWAQSAVRTHYGDRALRVIAKALGDSEGERDD